MTSWLAAYLRYPALFANSFHGDEALFASWARLIAIWRDPLLQGQPVDKPPLLFYLQALFYPILGPVEWAARMPGFIASILLVPLVGMLVWWLYRDETAAIVASLMLAMSPLAIQFSATAFTDPLLTLTIVGTLYFVVRPRISQAQPAARNAGLWFGAALATKHQAWLFLPLFAGMAALSGWRKRQWGQALLGLAPWLLFLLAWDVARNGRPDLWSAQIGNFGGIRMAWSWELWPRWESWVRLWRWISAVPLLILLIPLALCFPRKAEDGRIASANQLLLLFLAGYFGLHWLLAIPIWDRYLLPLVPLIALPFGWTLSRLLKFIFAHIGAARIPGLYGSGTPAASILTLRLAPWALIALLVGQLPASAAARRGTFPIGGRADADQGAAEVADYLAEAPYGTVLYDHWFSWQWGYHLLDRRVYVSWFPSPDALAADLIAFAGASQPRYLALPRSDVALPVKRAVANAGFELLPVTESAEAGIDLFQIFPQGSADE